MAYMKAPSIDPVPTSVCHIWKNAAPKLMNKPNHTSSASPAAITPLRLAAWNSSAEPPRALNRSQPPLMPKNATANSPIRPSVSAAKAKAGLVDLKNKVAG